MEDEIIKSFLWNWKGSFYTPWSDSPTPVSGSLDSTLKKGEEMQYRQCMVVDPSLIYRSSFFFMELFIVNKEHIKHQSCAVQSPQNFAISAETLQFWAAQKFILV